MHKNIHIIGANGYIGSLLTNYLRAAGHVVDIAKYRLPNIQKNSIDADIVIHSAMSGGGTIHKPRAGNNDPEYMRKVNINGMKALLAGLKRIDTKILYLSSTAVYGKFDDSPLVNEEHALLPVSVYGQHKVESEAILKQSDFDWMILRPCGVFGPSVGNNFGNSFLNIVIEKAIKNKQVDVYGGDQLIDTVYILDLITVILQSVNNEWYPRQIFNMGGEIVEVEKMLSIVSGYLNNLGIDCQLINKDFKRKPAVLTNSTKLKSTFQDFNHTPLNISIHTLVYAWFFQNNVLT